MDVGNPETCAHDYGMFVMGMGPISDDDDRIMFVNKDLSYYDSIEAVYQP